jgi:hypothetical protein
MFHFLYADGHKMLTIGGMIGDETHSRRIRGSTIADTVYFRRDFKSRPYEVYVSSVNSKGTPAPRLSYAMFQEMETAAV